MNDYQDFRPPLAPLADAPDESAELADRGSRLAAKCLDGLTWFGLLVLLGIASAIAIPAMLAARRADRFAPGQALAAGAVIGTILVLGIVGLIVWNCLWLHRYGQTVGKRAAGIRIVRTSGERASLGRIFALRFLPTALLGAIPVAGFLIFMTDTLLVFRDSRQCLHDQIADTKVVKFR